MSCIHNHSFETPHPLVKAIVSVTALMAITALVISIIGLIASSSGIFKSIVQFGSTNQFIVLGSACTVLLFDLAWLCAQCKKKKDVSPNEPVHIISDIPSAQETVDHPVPSVIDSILMPSQVENPKEEESAPLSSPIVHPLIQELQFAPIDKRQIEERMTNAETALKELEVQLSLEAIDSPLLITEDRLCEYLSKLSLNLAGKRFVVLSLDLGGFGDFTFGLKTLSMLNHKFPGIHAVLASDSPVRALKVNGSHNHPILMPSIQPEGKLKEDEMVNLIEHFEPEFLIVAPVTSYPKGLEPLIKRTPYFAVREYGFREKEVPLQKDEYMGGIGKNEWKGVIVHKELQRWATSVESEDPLARLANLRFLPHLLTQAILGKEYSEQAILDFAKHSELFGAYGNDFSKVEFILSLLGMHKKLGSSKNLSFVLAGEAQDTLGLLEKNHSLLKEAQVGAIRLIDLNQMSDVRTIKLAEGGKMLTLIFVSLLPEDILHLVKSSEKEGASTGDQSWVEFISAHKRWVQQDLIHKRDSVRGVINLAPNLSNPAARAFHELVQKAHEPAAVTAISHKRVQGKAELFFLARTDKNIAKCWDLLNAEAYEHTIEPWLIGMVIKKYLENQWPEFKKRVQNILAQKTINPAELLSFLKETQQVINAF